MKGFLQAPTAGVLMSFLAVLRSLSEQVEGLARVDDQGVSTPLMIGRVWR